MKALAPQDPRSWVFQRYMHATPQPKAQMLNAIFQDTSDAAFELATDAWYTYQSHRGEPEDYFLRWHRLYVMRFEEIIRRLTERDEFALPYWDYTSATTNGRDWADTSFIFASAEGERIAFDISTISNSAALRYKYDRLPGAAPGATLVSSSSQMKVLMKSIGAGAVATSSSLSQPASPLALGWAPVKTVLAPTSSQNQLCWTIAASTKTNAGHLVLLLRNVRANLDPNTVYQVFLNLPENATDEVEDQHYVGLLNFFGIEAQLSRGAGGRDIEFDVTDLINGPWPRPRYKIRPPSLLLA